MSTILIEKRTKNSFIVTSSFKFPGEGKMYCLENKELTIINENENFFKGF